MLSNYIPFITPAAYSIAAYSIVAGCCCLAVVNEATRYHHADDGNGHQVMSGIDICLLSSVLFLLPMAAVCALAVNKITSVYALIIIHSVYGGCTVCCASVGGWTTSRYNRETYGKTRDDMDCVNEQPQPEQDSVIIAEPITNEVQECVIMDTIVQAVVVDENNYKECDF